MFSSYIDVYENLRTWLGFYSLQDAASLDTTPPHERLGPSSPGPYLPVKLPTLIIIRAKELRNTCRRTARAPLGWAEGIRMAGIHRYTYPHAHAEKERRVYL